MMIVWDKYVEEKNKHVLPTNEGLVVPEELLQAGQQLAADVGSRFADVINALYARGLEIAEQSLSAEKADVALIRQQADEELNDAVSSITLLEQQLDDRSAERDCSAISNPLAYKALITSANRDPTSAASCCPA
jgi:hypothetical protein